MSPLVPGAGPAPHPDAGFGVYLHIPFCPTRCHYCDFVTFTGMEGLRVPYARALGEEVRLAAEALHGTPSVPVPTAPPVTSVFVGGGTPTLLPPDELVRLLELVQVHLPVADGAEVTVEANPETVDDRLAEALVTAGVTRVSLGAQSFDDRVLAALGRGPGEDDASWSATLDAAVALAPDHVSAYALTIEPATKFGRLVAAGAMQPPADDDLAGRYETVCDRLGVAGLIHYEVSNWARGPVLPVSGTQTAAGLPAHASRHNLTYWRRGTYLGLGTGAHGFDGRVRSWNVRGVPPYLAALRAGRRPVAGSEDLDETTAAFERLVLGLRTADGLSAADAHALGVDPDGAEVDGLRELDLLAPGPGLRLTERGMFLHGEVVTRLAP